MLIRQATVNDVKIIRQMAEEVWWPTYSPILSAEQIKYMLGAIYSAEKITTQIVNQEQTYLLLTDNEKPVGFASYSPREDNADIYKLHKLYCLPSTQGKGCGKMLINKVETEVLSAGKNVLELNVNRYNKAFSFYEKMGFVIAYEEDIAIGPYWMND